jgi:hypothetical protein
MNRYFRISGDLKEIDFPIILYNMHQKEISGTLIIKNKNYEKRVVIRNKRVIFANSNDIKDSFEKYLLRNNIINQKILKKTSEYVKRNVINFRRGLIELGYINYDEVWKYKKDHLKDIIFSLFNLHEGDYEILTDDNDIDENIVLNIDIPSIITEGMRNSDIIKIYNNSVRDIDDVYPLHSEIISNLELKDYEIHILDLVRKASSIDEIIKKSELLEKDTLRILCMFLVLEIISEKRIERKEINIEENISGLHSFNSFEDALKHYNMKYEMIYKLLSKEIGPIALSILFKEVNNIVDALPFCLQKIKLNTNGTLKEDMILKSVWYYDFGKQGMEFLKGLEEILYAEIYAVKKHLGIDYEQQILRWINSKGM